MQAAAQQVVADHGQASGAGFHSRAGVMRREIRIATRRFETHRVQGAMRSDRMIRIRTENERRPQGRCAGANEQEVNQSSGGT